MLNFLDGSLKLKPVASFRLSDRENKIPLRKSQSVKTLIVDLLGAKVFATLLRDPVLVNCMKRDVHQDPSALVNVLLSVPDAHWRNILWSILLCRVQILCTGRPAHTQMSRRMNSYHVIGEGPNSEKWRNSHTGELMCMEICSS